MPVRLFCNIKLSNSRYSSLLSKRSFYDSKTGLKMQRAFAGFLFCTFFRYYFCFFSSNLLTHIFLNAITILNSYEHKQINGGL